MAKFFFIAFDLPNDANEQIRKSAVEQIRETFPMNFQPVSNGWVIKTEMEADDLRLWLTALIHPSTQSFACYITRPVFGIPSDAKLPEWFMLDYQGL